MIFFKNFIIRWFKLERWFEFKIGNIFAPWQRENDKILTSEPYYWNAILCGNKFAKKKIYNTKNLFQIVMSPKLFKSESIITSKVWFSVWKQRQKILCNKLLCWVLFRSTGAKLATTVGNLPYPRKEFPQFSKCFRCKQLIISELFLKTPHCFCLPEVCSCRIRGDPILDFYDNQYCILPPTPNDKKYLLTKYRMKEEDKCGYVFIYHWSILQ